MIATVSQSARSDPRRHPSPVVPPTHHGPAGRFRATAVGSAAARVLGVVVPATGGATTASARPAAAAPSVGDLGGCVESLDHDLDRLLFAFEVPGAAVALMHGGTTWSKGYGQADVRRKTPVTGDTVFQVASLSKPVTAWGVLRLVEQGRLRLDAPVQTYLTRWHLPSGPYDPAGVTVRRLLSHTAGLADNGGYPGLAPDRALPSLEQSSAGDNGGNGALHIAVAPGTRFRYPGDGYTLLQLLIEEVTGERFSAYMQGVVLNPLGMTHSGFGWRPELGAGLATAYGARGTPLPDHRFTEQAAAGLYSTAADLGRFVAAALPGAAGAPTGAGVLRPETVAMTAAPVALVAAGTAVTRRRQATR